MAPLHSLRQLLQGSHHSPSFPNLVTFLEGICRIDIHLTITKRVPFFLHSSYTNVYYTFIFIKFDTTEQSIITSSALLFYYRSLSSPSHGRRSKEPRVSPATSFSLSIKYPEINTLPPLLSVPSAPGAPALWLPAGTNASPSVSCVVKLPRGDLHCEDPSPFGRLSRARQLLRRPVNAPGGGGVEAQLSLVSLY